MKTVGLIGWRGMVGSVLLQRMQEEQDLERASYRYFSTSQAGQNGPDGQPLGDAHDVAALADCDILVSCQGGSYTEAVHPELRNAGWDGYWIDAASTLRMADSSLIVLDPVNRALIDQGIDSGVRDFVGGNCTVSLMLMGLGALFREGWVEWVSSMTYQSASGAGAANMLELVDQFSALSNVAGKDHRPASATALDVDRMISDHLRSEDFPIDQFGAPLAASLLPWIDRRMDDGRTREEWKGMVETNKILQTSTPIPVDGICVRVGAMRCHSQALTIKLTEKVPLEDIEETIQGAHAWSQVVPNDKDATLAHLTPTAVSGSLKVPVGRLRKLSMGPEYLGAFTVGDQLLWGAAEPLRRMLRILLDG